CIDTGYGQIAHKLRDDPRVSLMERTNARLLQPGDLNPYATDKGIGFFSMDVSFISATLVLPPVVAAVREANRMVGLQDSPIEAVILVKPQFEAGREHIGKGGIVRDPEAQKFAVDRVCAVVEILQGKQVGITDSPILGAEGNREFLLHAWF
ncbi:MAG: SAM-dependent methyltransferase, partial [Acidobacteriaceae bacterium]